LLHIERLCSVDDVRVIADWRWPQATGPATRTGYTCSDLLALEEAMSKVYLEELVGTETEDGLLLDGAVIRPDGVEAKPVAVVWIHGFTGNFYEPCIVTIGRALAGYGYTLVTGNNRGHHCGATLDCTDGQPLLGGWWERLDESPHAVAAWINVAAGLGFHRVALLGHSLGAMKGLYYQAQRQDPRVAGMIVASPPLAAGPLSPETRGRAEALVADGRGEDLLPWGSLGGAAR
jgi:pimeloyl-ACP methyl ester carboxylesterase